MDKVQLDRVAILATLVANRAANEAALSEAAENNVQALERAYAKAKAKLLGNETDNHAEEEYVVVEDHRACLDETISFLEHSKAESVEFTKQEFKDLTRKHKTCKKTASVSLQL